MPNMKQIISTHNKKILKSKPQAIQEDLCNCTKEPCPLQGKCLSSVCVVYNAKVTNTTDNTCMNYIGQCGNDFKGRHAVHKNSFKYRNKRTSTLLAGHIWKLKDEKKNYKIEWSIEKKSTGYNQTSKTCNLCLSEKASILAFEPKEKLINSRSEIISKCRHENKYILQNN